MPENRDYITSSADGGSVSISEDVVSSIAALAVGEVSGVAGLAGAETPAPGELPDRKSLARALKITEADGGAVSVDVAIRTRYGEKIPAVAAELQNAVGQAIESLAGLRVAAVNVRVVGLDFSAQEEK